MPTSSCLKCHILPCLTNSGGDLIISCEVPELTNKSKILLKSLKISFKEEDVLTLILHVSSFKEFIELILDSNVFSKHERESIRMLFLAPSEELTPSKIKDVKTLQKLKDILGATNLSNLLSKGGLTTHFQPIIDIKEDKIYGYETLARGVNDDGSLIYPDKLFSWAREGDMLFYLDRACRESSLKTAAVKNVQAKVFINFIPTAIYDPKHCLQATVKWANSLEFDPKNIIFEVIESDQVEDLAHLKSILDFYKSKGFMVALDDVGSGYSSLNMIAALVPDIVKIDRAIIDKIDLIPANQSVFRAIVSIAKENNIKVLAEGIERKEELAFVAANGADLVQGYYFAKPSAEPIRKISY
jgi:EAL domain-containing protein (putative c-di-GMP-specific phosphodiesterase class I)